ncbi:MAG: NAD(P)-dependent oxidoreductase [Lentisphaerae bacterium]|nr:NAD(P)-dependent oxidoreductase [Lentisphaerota bacterium]
MALTPDTTTIGFVGIGVMGKSMAGHLLKAGYPVHVYNRTQAKAEDLIAAGAQWQDSPSALAQRCNCIITIVGFPRDVEDIYLGAAGIINQAHAGSVLIDMTTSKPSLARTIFTEAKKKGLAALDAPVSGGDLGAREARLSIMVGGEPSDFEAALPVFQVMGKNVVLQGPAGSGQHTKMANQIAIAANMMGVCEALAYAKKAGLDQETVLKSISGGAAGSWSLTNLAPRIIAGNYDPGFYVKHFIKDMGIALESAAEMKLETPSLSLAKSLYERLAAQGGNDLGTQGLYKLFS